MKLQQLCRTVHMFRDATTQENTHLEYNNTDIRMMFADFHSAFNTLSPMKLIGKFSTLGLSTTLCNLIFIFLTNRPQTVQTGGNTSSTLVLNTRAPQVCVLRSLLFTLFTYNCNPRHPRGNSVVKFADDTTIIN